MSQIIRMSPQEVREVASVYQNASVEIEHILTKITKTQMLLADQWQGMSFTAFEVQYNEIVPVVKNFSQLMSDISQQLISISQTLQDTDLQLSQQLSRRM